MQITNQKRLAARLLKCGVNRVWVNPDYVDQVAAAVQTDDIRESPSLIIIPDLQENGMNISAYDPEGEKEASKILKDVNWKKSAYEAAENVDCLVILTDWEEFKNLDLDKIKNSMKRPLIYDFRNIFDPDMMTELGFEYFSIGRG